MLDKLNILIKNNIISTLSKIKLDIMKTSSCNVVSFALFKLLEKKLIMISL